LEETYKILHSIIATNQISDGDKSMLLSRIIFESKLMPEDSLAAFRYVLSVWDTLDDEEFIIEADLSYDHQKYKSMIGSSEVLSFSTCIEDLAEHYDFETASKLLFDLIVEEVDEMKRQVFMEIILLSGFLPYDVKIVFRELTIQEKRHFRTFQNQIKAMFNRFVLDIVGEDYSEAERQGGFHVFASTTATLMKEFTHDPFLMTVAIESLLEYFFKVQRQEAEGMYQTIYEKAQDNYIDDEIERRCLPMEKKFTFATRSKVVYSTDKDEPVN